MDLQKLFKMQKELDEHIEKKHPRKEGEDRLTKKILALQVELAECAQESRCFKYWSNDQEPRNEEIVEGCTICMGLSYEANEHCEGCNGVGAIYKNPLLEEYVDCLHFVLSIGLELGMDEIADELDLKKFNFLTSNTILSCFIGLSYDIADFYYQRENVDMVPYLYEHILYKQYGIALINKRPTPVKVLKTRGVNIIRAVWDSKSTVDYDGVYNGMPIAFEAKSVKGKRFDLKNIQKHQLEYLTDAEKHGAASFFLIEMRDINTVYYVPLSMAQSYIKQAQKGGRKSIPLDDFAVYAYEVNKGRRVPLDYLAVLDKIEMEKAVSS